MVLANGILIDCSCEEFIQVYYMLDNHKPKISKVNKVSNGKHAPLTLQQKLDILKNQFGSTRFRGGDAVHVVRRHPSLIYDCLKKLVQLGQLMYDKESHEYYFPSEEQIVYHSLK